MTPLRNLKGALESSDRPLFVPPSVFDYFAGEVFSKFEPMKALKRLICCFVLAGFCACSSSDDPVIVSVGSTKLRLSEIKAQAPEWDSWGNRDRLAFLDHWVDEEIIYQEAEANGILKDTVLSNQIETMKRKMTVDYFLQTFTDSMLVTDAEKQEFYKTHQELFLREKTTASGAILYFSEWNNGDAYYRGHKGIVYDSFPNPHFLVKKIVTFDSVNVTPDSCLIPNLKEAEVGRITKMKVCGNALKIGIVTSRLDSGSVYPFKEVADDVAMRAWLDHQQKVLDRLKKEWKSSRPIFMKTNVFSDKEK